MLKVQLLGRHYERAASASKQRKTSVKRQKQWWQQSHSAFNISISHLFRIWLKWSLNLVKKEKHKNLESSRKRNPVRYPSTGKCGQLMLLRILSESKRGRRVHQARKGSRCQPWNINPKWQKKHEQFKPIIFDQFRTANSQYRFKSRAWPSPQTLSQYPDENAPPLVECLGINWGPADFATKLAGARQ